MINKKRDNKDQINNLNKINKIEILREKTKQKKTLFLLIFSLIILLLFFFLLFFFTKQSVNNLKENKNNLDNNKLQIANPASTYCIKNNGSLEIRENENGQYGICIKNGKECDEWAFFRGECEL
jgi:putative hemolysin